MSQPVPNFSCTRFVRCENGSTAIEYALIASLIAVGIAAALQLLGHSVSNFYQTLVSYFN